MAETARADRAALSGVGAARAAALRTGDDIADHLLQQGYALSDPAREEALHEIPTLRRFAQLGGLDDILDETTILNFRRLLEAHGVAGSGQRASDAQGPESTSRDDRRCDADRCARFDQKRRSRARP